MGLRSPAAPVKTLDVAQNCGQFTQFNNLWVLDRAQCKGERSPLLCALSVTHKLLSWVISLADRHLRATRVPGAYRPGVDSRATATATLEGRPRDGPTNRPAWPPRPRTPAPSWSPPPSGSPGGPR